MENSFKKRINYEGKIEDISMQICKDYRLGEFKSNKLILTGYEDFNFKLETEDNKYLVKIFSNFRNLEDCKRYVNVLGKTIEAGIATPKLYKSEQGYLHIMNINETNLRLCVMEYINGKTIYELKQKLTSDEIRFLSQQAALINSIKIKPKLFYDSWAITNFPKEFEKKSNYLSSEDKNMLEPIVDKFRELKIENLPHCFVHGDIITTNIIRDKNNKLWLIDFSVSNYYPRIQELAVLACNLLFDENSKKNTERNLNIVLEEYQKSISLTKEELDSLPLYTKLAHAMYILGASFSKNAKGNTSEENKYWLNQGRAGLKQMLK